MKHKEYIEISRSTELVDDALFDEHMTKARVRDIESRKNIFDRQTQTKKDREDRVRNIKTSIY